VIGATFGHCSCAAPAAVLVPDMPAALEARQAAPTGADRSGRLIDASKSSG
jgi:hypothetical protein